MRTSLEIRDLPETDILIVGAGSAGCVAALAARESRRHRVLLVERYGFAGGCSTQVLDTFYGFFTPGEFPRKVVGGIPDRVVNALDDVGAVFLRPNTYGAGTGVNYNPERLKWVWDRLLSEAGVDVLLHASLIAVESNPRDKICSVIIHTRGGLRRVRARRFIDASGDAELCHQAGIPYEKAGDIEPAQTLTTTFRMSNVDISAYERAGGKKMLAERMTEAVESGAYALPRKAGSLHRMNAEKCIATVAVRVADLDPMDSRQLTSAEVEGRRQAFLYEDFLRACIPGFESSHIIGMAHQIGIRETRRVYGEYRLTREDCMRVARFPDAVLLCGAPIEDHRAAPGGGEETVWAYVPESDAYDVPYRSLVPRGREEIWVIGRCFSATHDAHASCRSMGQTMSMGQAAGFAAAQSLEKDESACALDTARLREQLFAVGAVLQTPGQAARTGTAEWRLNTFHP